MEPQDSSAFSCVFLLVISMMLIYSETPNFGPDIFETSFVNRPQFHDHEIHNTVTV